MKTGWPREVVQARYLLKFSHLFGVGRSCRENRVEKIRSKTPRPAVTALQHLLTSGFDKVWR